MRLAPLAARSLATGVASLVVLALAPDAAFAAQSLSCDTNPINASTATAAAFSGTDAAGSVETVTAGNGGTTATATASTGLGTTFSGTVNVSSLPDGTVTLTASSGPLGTTAHCLAAKDTVPPTAPTTPLVSPISVNKATQGALAVSTTAAGSPSAVALTVTDKNGKPLTVFPTGSAGSYAATFDVTGLADGPLSVTATTYDAAGNTATSAATTVAKDATPPAAPTVTAATPTTTTGFTTVSTSDPGTGQKVTLSGSTSEASTYAITVTDANGKVVSLTAPSGTTYSAAFDPYQLADGPLAVSVVATDTAGNAGPAGTKTLSKDTTVPVVTGLTVTPDPIGAAGQKTVTVRGTAVRSTGSTTPSEAGTSVVVALTGTTALLTNPPAAQTVTIATDGTFSAAFDSTNLQDGTLTATAKPTDPAGNAGATASSDVTKDTVAPAAPAVTALGNDTGSNNEVVPVSGTAEKGSSVVVTVTDGKGTAYPLAPVTASAVDGTYSTTFDARPLPQGSYTAKAVATDAAGNSSAASAAASAQKDTVTLALTGTSPASGGRVKGTSPVSASYNEPLAVGTSTVVVKDSGNAPVSGTTSYKDGGATLVFTPSSALPDGTYTANFDAHESRVGGDSVVGTVVPFTVDSTVPAAPTLTSVTDPVSKADATAVHVVGTTEPGDTVSVRIADGTTPTPGSATASGTADGSGHFDVTVDVHALADGPLTASATATDPVGNGPSATSNTLSTTKDTVAPTISGAAATDTTAASPTTTVSGTVSEGGLPVTVTVTDGKGGTASATTTAASNGTYSVKVDTSGLADGTDTASAVATDAAGNASPPATASFTKDTTGPTVTSLTASTVDVAAAGSTTVTGSTGEAGSTVTVTVTDSTGSKVVGTPTPDATGHFSATLDVSGLADGTLTVSAVAADSVGNPGPEATTTAKKDTAAPVVTGLAATATTAATSSSTVSGSTEPGAAVALDATDGTVHVTGTATADGSGAFTTSLDLSSLADGTVTVTAAATDAVGNTGPTATTTAARDTAAPSVTALRATATSTATPSSTVTGTTDDPTAAVTVTATDGTTTVGPVNATTDSTGAFTASVDLSSLQDGPVTVTATATDGVGNTGTRTATTSKDTTAPAVTGLAATDVAPGATATTVTGSAPTAVTVALSATDGTHTVTGTATVANDGSFTGTLEVGTLAYGTLTVTATATDAAGNAGTASTTAQHGAPTAPSRPAAPTAQAGNAKALVGFTPPAANGSAITSYTVTSSPGGKTATGSSSPLFVYGLTNGTSYTFTVTATNGVGTSSPSPASNAVTPMSQSVRYVALAPSRLLDTRGGNGATGPVAGGGTVALQVLGRGGVPSSGVSAVVLNVTVTGPTASGYVTAFAHGAARPNASNLNYTKGQTVPNLVVVPVGADGKISLFNGSGGSTQLLADVAGYYTTGSTTGGGSFGALAPSRLLDTRNGNGATGPVAGGGTVALQVLGRGGVPSSGVRAVVLNVTVTGPTASGYVTAYPHGTTRPNASNLNYTKGQTVPNLVVVPVGADGKISLFNGSGGSTQLLADVAGYYASGTPSTSGAFGALAPSRLLDTRNGNGATGPVAGGATVALQVLGRGGVPSSGVSAVVLNVTVTGPTASGYVTAFAHGAARPNASNLNYTKGETVPNLVVVPVGADGKVSLFNGSGGSTQLLADIAGYYLS